MFSTLTKTDKLVIARENIVLPRYVLVNKFDESSAEKFAEDFYACIDTKQSVIPVYIDSFGGYVYSLLSMLDVIKTSPVPVATIVIGKAMSCGAVLLSAGTDGYRFASSNATVMIHEAASGSHGKVEEMKVDVAETTRLNDKIIKIMSNNCGKDDGYFARIIHEKNHADWYLDPQECQNHNLINHIRIPKFETKISVDSVFG